MRRIRRNHSFKWEPNWVKHYGIGQTNQGEVLDNYCHVASTLKALCSKGHIITITSFFNISSAECEIVEEKWEPGEKPLNPMKRTEEENQETSENIIAS